MGYPQAEFHSCARVSVRVQKANFPLLVIGHNALLTGKTRISMGCNFGDPPTFSLFRLTVAVRPFASGPLCQASRCAADVNGLYLKSGEP